MSNLINFYQVDLTYIVNTIITLAIVNVIVFLCFMNYTYPLLPSNFSSGSFSNDLLLILVIWISARNETSFSLSLFPHSFLWQCWMSLLALTTIYMQWVCSKIILPGDIVWLYYIIYIHILRIFPTIYIANFLQQAAH